MVFEETEKYKGVTVDVLVAAFREAKAGRLIDDGQTGPTIEQRTKAELERIRRKGFEIEREEGTGVFKPLSETKALQLLKMIAAND